jgi:hypothetical protein
LLSSPRRFATNLEVQVELMTEISSGPSHGAVLSMKDILRWANP